MLQVNRALNGKSRIHMKRLWSNGGVVVKLLACRARGPGFKYESHHFRESASPASQEVEFR